MRKKTWKKILAMGLCVANVMSMNITSFAAQNMKENVAKGKTAASSSDEADSLVASKAVDGDKSTRWASRQGLATDTNPHWLYVDLGEEMDVRSVRISWEYQKANKYKIQTATTLSSPMAESDWTDAKVLTTHPASREEIIDLGEARKARYVRVYVHGSTSEDPGGGTAWPTISIYELEVYGGLPPKSLEEIMGDIEISLPEEGATEKKLQVEIPNVADYEDFVDSENADDYEIKYNGTDYEQVIGDDLTVYETVQDVTVNVSFKATNKETGAYQFKEIPVTIPASITPVEGENAAPNVLPELREWDGGTGDFTPAESSRIIIGDDYLEDMAKAFQADYKEITGKELTIVPGELTDAKAGEFFFDLTKDKTKGLQKEGYLLNVTDKVAVEAEETTGAYWATRTILQSLKKDGKIPQGMAKDYPLYEVRGYILDVGRKTFTLDNLYQTMKEMSWYKLNDFQVHINDNFIFLENYSNSGRDPMTAYSGFRLESDIKEGGKITLPGEEGEEPTEYTYQADLTNKDVWYSKKDFKNFILDSRVRGVNIVPEIDTPAHSLALTKVLPELRHGTNGRDNDHLALSTKYNACLAFVQTIFDEYMGEDLSPDEVVFDRDTTVHMGADEYSAAPEKYRKFADDMLKYVQDSGRTARIWGSLTSIKGNTPVRAKDVQMNLWNSLWAKMDQMYEEGFDLINCNDGGYYIVPNSGYYHPNGLDNNAMYNQPINSIGGVTIPAGDDQMIGGAFAVWNDMIDDMDNGVSEYDVYKLIEDTIPLYAANLWGKKSLTKDQALALSKDLGIVPGTNFEYEVEKKEDVVANYPMDDAAAEKLSGATNAEIKTVDGRNALELKGEASYIKTEFETAGLGNSLRVKVKRTSGSTEDQILFESPYGSIKAVQGKTGKVGFSRENFDYSFNYTLPVNEWVELEFKNELHVAKLYVNGALVDTLGDGDGEGEIVIGPEGPVKLWATTMFPIEKIGSKTNAFVGYVDDVRIGTNKEYASTMALDYAVMTACEVADLNTNTTLKGLVDQANAVFKKYEATAEEISSLVTSINAEIAKIEYEKADYVTVDFYKGLVENLDLELFAEEGVAVLNTVLSSVREDLPESMQATVDAYGDALKVAVQALELKESANVNYVDNSTITATASSHQDGGSAPNKALDGDPATIWHSKWSIETFPHWISFELKQPTEIKALTYVPRPGGGNGNVKTYEIQISDDGTTFTKHKEGTLQANAETKTIEFTPVTTKHVRLHIIDAAGKNGSAAEVMIHLASVPADTEGLRELLDQVYSMENHGYAFDTWKALMEKTVEGEEILASAEPNANDIEVLKREIYGAMADLQVGVEAESITLENASVNVGSKKFLTIAMTPENAATNLTWESTKEDVATVENGVVTGLKEGTTTITVKTANNKTATADVTVEKVSVEKVELDKTSVSLAVDGTETLTATVTPNNATNKEVTWTTSAPDVVAVENGVITALKEGTATITATADGKTATCEVTVVEASQEEILVEEVTLDQETAIIYTGTVHTLTATVTPDNATNKEVTWTSSDPTVVDVGGGVLMALKEGTVTITATAGGKSATCEVTVVEDPVGVIGHLLGTASAYVESDYTTESWSEYKKALEAARTFLPNAGEATYEEANEVKLALEAAIAGLVKKSTEEADKIATYRAEISKLIAEGAGYKKEEYTPESWSGYQEVLKKVTAVMDNQEATFQQLKDSLAQLKSAIFTLRKKDPAQGGNQQPGNNNQQGGNTATGETQKVQQETAAINQLIQQGSTYKETEYTKEAWSAYQAAKDHVTKLLSSGTATSLQLSTAKESLQKAIDTLLKSALPDTDTVVHKKNQKLTFKDASYKVTKEGKTGGEVALVKYNGKGKKFTTPKTITVDGIKYKVTSVANNAFKKNKTLTNIVISANVKTIGNSVFQNCAKLTNVTIGKDVTKLGKNLFKGSKKLKSIVFKTTKLTASGLAKKSLAGIGKTTKVKVPKKQLKAYKKFFTTKGLGKTVKVTK